MSALNNNLFAMHTESILVHIKKKQFVSIIREIGNVKFF